MAQSIEGIYRDGKIELCEVPTGMREGRVRVTLVEVPTKEIASGRLQYGKYRTGRLSTDEDFRDAEWRGKDLLGGE